MVNSIKNIWFILILLSFSSCEKVQNMTVKESKNNYTFRENLYNKINLFIDSSSCRKDKIVEVRYQKFDNKEFIQISTQKIFITDSLCALEEYKNHLLAFYNNDVFDTVIKRRDREAMINKYKQWNLYEIDFTETGFPCFDMYEIIDYDLINVARDSYYYNNLFSAPPMLTPPPPPNK